MNGTERIDALVAENMRLRNDMLRVVELVADLAHRRHLWQALMTQTIREKAALHVANDRLRQELSRYTRRQME